MILHIYDCIRYLLYGLLLSSVIPQIHASVFSLENGLEDRQVFLRSELPDVFSFHQKKTFRVLNLHPRCLHHTLTSCLTDYVNYHAIRDRCFTDVCPREQYFCLNYGNNHTIHICGIPLPWKKRRRSIAVLESPSSKSADVYDIDCSVGYVHNNANDMFNLCVKDVTIVVVRGATDTSPAIGRCRSEKRYRYCNPKGVTFFELGSDNDNCWDEHDHQQKCSKTTELMPNCSCVQKCQDGVERDWDETFLCKPANVIMISTKEGIEDFTFKPKTTTSQEIVSVGTERDVDLSVNDRKDINSHRPDTAVVILLIIAVTLVCVLVIIIIRYIKRHVQGNSEVANVLQADRTNADISRHSSKLYSKNITNEKKTYNSKHVNVYNITGTDTVVNIQGLDRGLELQNLLENQEPSQEDISDNNSLIEQQNMENLKECENGSSDSGMYTGDETTRKVIA